MHADSRNSHPVDRRGPHARRGRGGNFHGQSRPSSSHGVVCRFCNFAGHEVKHCRKLQKFLRNNQILPSSYPASPTVHTMTVNPMTSGQQWLFDSGASHHVTSDNTNLPTYSTYGGPDEVHLGDGSGHGGSAHARGEHS
ncbi:unnamed protein product [Cuscuta epithymum]|uniref:Uncharacterized protein n=1 Tax=Cuscuta epithymum TaxID=186058 RepID=A0AAV0CCB8_9ASTE|nr:unnamed protein product [Cuscuta epithymum]